MHTAIAGTRLVEKLLQPELDFRVEIEGTRKAVTYCNVPHFSVGRMGHGDLQKEDGNGQEAAVPVSPCRGTRRAGGALLVQGRPGPFPAVLCRRHRPGAPGQAPQGRPGREGGQQEEGAARAGLCAGLGAAAAGAERGGARLPGRCGQPGEGGRALRPVTSWEGGGGRWVSLSVCRCRLQGGREAGQGGRGDSGDGKRQLGGTAALG